MKKTEKSLPMLSGALLFACGLAGLIWRAAAERAAVSLVLVIIFMSVGAVLVASAQNKQNKQ
ncbi:MAG: hypothetical protein K2G66_03265 [Alistipes sp.]|nr:hypothetical protein [Alistipes sp.]MDE5906632.1 hypothetical protein [Alistipes sp.]